ncbi:MAG: hydroxyacid dehydrogenase [Planctomycetota bacterium]|nr:hydroxyacid dehydrogenase [Planctomycetota bacterium]
MPLRVCIPWLSDDDFAAALHEHAAGLDVRLSKDDVAAEILVAGVPEPDLVDRLAALRAIVIPYAGVPKRTRELVAARGGLALHNLHHNAVPTAETAVALMLAAAKSVVPIDRALRAHDWRPRYALRHDLLCDGATTVVLGAGAIGSHIGKLCTGLGMNAVPVRRGDGANWRERIANASALFVSVPWTEQTEGMVDAAALAQLPDGCIVVNVSRGPVIDEDALYQQLSQGRLSAALDVWWNYPQDEDAREHTPPANHPFHELDNVVMSPHRAGHCDGIERLRAQHLARLLDAAVRGEEMPNRVDLERGY